MRGGRDHTSHRLVYQGLSDKRAVVLLAVVSAALGLTSLAYRVLGDTRITLAGVLITFAFAELSGMTQVEPAGASMNCSFCVSLAYEPCIVRRVVGVKLYRPDRLN